MRAFVRAAQASRRLRQIVQEARHLLPLLVCWHAGWHAPAPQSHDGGKISTHILHIPQPGHALRQAPRPRPQPACRRSGGGLQLRRGRIIQPSRQLLVTGWVRECRCAGGAGKGNGGMLAATTHSVLARRRPPAGGGWDCCCRQAIAARAPLAHIRHLSAICEQRPASWQAEAAPARPHEGRVSRMRPRPASSPGQQCAATPPPRCRRQSGRMATTPCWPLLRRLFCLVGRSQSL